MGYGVESSMYIAPDFHSSKEFHTFFHHIGLNGLNSVIAGLGQMLAVFGYGAGDNGPARFALHESVLVAQGIEPFHKRLAPAVDG
jgi:hypothetical protein